MANKTYMPPHILNTPPVPGDFTQVSTATRAANGRKSGRILLQCVKCGRKIRGQAGMARHMTACRRQV